MMRRGELIRLSQENQVLSKNKRSGQINSGPVIWDDRQDVSTGFDRVFEFGRAEWSAKQGDRTNSCANNLVLIKVNVRSTKLDRNLLLAGEQ